MNNLYPILLGITTKIYDDIIDMNIKTIPIITESLKSLIILFFTLTSINDFYFSFPCFLVSLLNSGFDNPFWKSIIIISFIITVINLLQNDIPITKLIIRIFLSIIVLFCFLLFAYFEDRLFPEEVSIEKIVFRSLILIGFCFILLFGIIEYIPNFGKIPIKKTILILLSNLIISISTMVYFLNFSGKSLKELNNI